MAVKLGIDPDDEPWERIICAARNEFGLKGFSGAQVEAIARASQVSRQSIYYYFTSKDSLYRETISYFSHRLVQHLETFEFDAMLPYDALYEFYGSIFDFYCTLPNLADISIDYASQGNGLERSGNLTRKVYLTFARLMDRATQASGCDAASKRLVQFSMASFLICGSFIDPCSAWAIASGDVGNSRKPSKDDAVKAVLRMLDIQPGDRSFSISSKNQ